jgi:hypothetical protein
MDATNCIDDETGLINLDRLATSPAPTCTRLTVSPAPDWLSVPVLPFPLYMFAHVTVRRLACGRLLRSRQQQTLPS